MSNGALQTLFLPFDQEILSVPTAEQQFIAYGLEADNGLDNRWKQVLLCVQPSRPQWLQLKKAGFNVIARAPVNVSFDGGLLLLGKHRGRNEQWLAQLLEQVKPGGLLVIAGDKKLGIDSFRKRCAQISPIIDRMPKNHATVYWQHRPELIDPTVIANLKPAHKRIDDRFTTAPGMFSHGEIDKGSELLTNYLKGLVFGRVADFGAGWGYLTAACLDHAEKLQEIDLYEADYEALEAAKQNLSALQTTIPLNYFWHDLASEPITEIYDTIITNPPFHTGRQTDVSLGQSFIIAASRRLKSGGRLLLVANRQLPYETVLKQHFRQVIPLADMHGYKIIEARK